MSVDVGIRVGGEWLEDLVEGYSPPRLTYRADGGPYAVSWSQTLPDLAPTPAMLSAGARVPVTVMAGGTRAWAGYLDSSSWADGEMTAAGLCRQAESAVASGITGGATLDVGVAVYFAAARGAFPVGTLETLPVLSPDTPVGGNYVADLLDQHVLAAGRRWAVTPEALLFTRADPVTPSLFVEPGVAEFAVTTQKVCTAVWVTYKDRTTMGTRYVYVSSGDASMERIVDFSQGASMTAAEATTMGQRILAKSGASRQLVGSVEIPQGALTNGYGVEVELTSVRGQEMVRLEGSVDGRNGRSSTDVVAGEWVVDVAAGRATLTPVDAVADSFEDIVTELGGEAR